MGKSSYTLRLELNSLTSKKSTLETRVDQLKKIRGNLQTSLNDEVEAINKYYRNAKDSFQSGLTGLSDNPPKANDYDKFKQSVPSVDSKLSECLDNVDYEISRCQNSINSLQSSIWSKEAEIDQAVSEENAAKNASN